VQVTEEIQYFASNGIDVEALDYSVIVVDILDKISQIQPGYRMVLQQIPREEKEKESFSLVQLTKS
jgi:hypothetical protein